VPDIVGCYKGKFFGIECKAGKNTPTPLQEKNLRDIKKTDGIAVVVNEDNMNDIGTLLEGVNRLQDIPDPWSQWHEGGVD